MTTTYTWAIANLERESADGYVFTAHYVVAAISDELDAEGNPYSASAYGSIGLERPSKKLIPFDSLTPEIVTGWVKDKLGADKVAAVEAALTAQIEERINPTKLSGLPWNS
jgi:hypothetical protein